MIRPEDLPQVIPSDLPPPTSGPQWGDQDRTYRAAPHLVEAVLAGAVARLRVGTTSAAPAWTPEQFAEWLRSMDCPELEVPSVTEWFNRHSPVVPIEVQAKESA